MAGKVPISSENIAFERLNLSRHYLTVDCDFTCFLVLNPSGSVPSEGTDICALHTGAWQIDAWSLLTKKDFPNIAGFSACLVWDKTLVSDTAHAPQCVESDIDTANSVSSLKGQPVNITGFSMPAGEVLPVSVYSGESPVSDSNPLSTRGLREPFVFRVGDIIDVDRVISWCSQFVDNEDYDEFDFYGSVMHCDKDGSASVCTFPGYFSHSVDGHITEYDISYPPLIQVRARKDTHEIFYILFRAVGSLRYTSGSQSSFLAQYSSNGNPDFVARVFKM